MNRNKIIGAVATLFAIFMYTSSCNAGTHSGEAKESAITFESTSWEEVLAKAKKENKIVFVDAYADWCGPCKALSKKVFTKEEVGAFFNSNFINYKIDTDSKFGNEFARKYNVRALPTLLFISPEGEIVHRTMGYMYPEELIEAGEKAKQLQH